MTKYKVILADPPWRFGNKNTGGSMNSGSANKYPTLSLKEIQELTFPLNNNTEESHISKIADKNSILFLWVPTALNEYGFSTMKSWNFKYKFKIYWYKPYDKEQKKGKLGMGFWFRNHVEECLVGTRGNVKPFRSKQPNIIIEYPRKHSQKPEGFFNLVEPELEKFDLTPKLELFAREKRNGWDGWGFEYPK
jgi:N6-adenosine-specific RNA methylase IME4